MAPDDIALATLPARDPSERAAPRMRPIAKLPLFFELTGRKVVLAAASPGAAWKAELIAAAGADLHIFADRVAPELLALAEAPPAGRIAIIPRTWQPDDLTGAALAFGAIEDRAEAESFAAAARARGIPVNVVDTPDLCDFILGALVNRSPLLVAISTNGAAPVFGQAIRASIEALLPEGLKRWAETAVSWRERVKAEAFGFAGRRAFWEIFARRALGEPSLAPDADLLTQCLDEATRVNTQKVGLVSLVGAGPGDPEMLTMGAVRALQAADVILYDDLVAPPILDLARREARKIEVGKRGYKPSCKQPDINQLMTALALEGRRVVRLKSGDPLIFGRAGEEIEALEKAGIPVDVVPGITSAQGAASRLRISLTHRDHARRLQMITAHDRHGKLPPDIDWSAIADQAATTVVYMPKRTIAELAAVAMANGMPADMPAVAIGDATRPGQIVLRATIATIAETLAAHPLSGPVLIGIGRVFEPVKG